MGWFDEQIRMRKQTDDLAFSDSFKQIAGSVMGRRLYDSMNNDRRITENAIGEILQFYHAAHDPVRSHDILQYLIDISDTVGNITCCCMVILQYLTYRIFRHTTVVVYAFIQIASHDRAGDLLE